MFVLNRFANLGSADCLVGGLELSVAQRSEPGKRQRSQEVEERWPGQIAPLKERSRDQQS
jgi:hypothetical protein